jgi:hypothetical protein
LDYYHVFRRDRSHKGGGVMILVKSVFDAIELNGINQIIESMVFSYCA